MLWRDALARNRGQSLNKLMEEMSAQVLAAYDTENRVRVMAEPKGMCNRL